MTNVSLEGEVQLGPDGVLQGWCWDPCKKTERLVLEVLIDEKVVSTFIASRFREDLRGRNIGDGYYGFIATLTKSLLDAENNFVISVRERVSSRCIWRQVMGLLPLQNDFASRLAEATRCFSNVAHSRRFRSYGEGSLVSMLSMELGTLGVYLQSAAGLGGKHLRPIGRARAALLQQMAPVVLEIPRNPVVTVIIIADATSNGVLSTVAAVAPVLKLIGASILLIDRGVNADVSLTPSLFGNLHYIYDQRVGLESVLAKALQYSRGDLLIVLKNPDRSAVHGLPEIVAQPYDYRSVYVNLRCAEAACGICAVALENISKRAAKFPIGLLFAGKRKLFEQIHRASLLFDEVTAWEDVHLAVLAVRDGIDLCIWDESKLEHGRELNVEATH